MFGEEYTLVAVADYVLSKPQNTVSNICRLLLVLYVILPKNMVEPIKQVLWRSKCGRINTKKTNAIIGGRKWWNHLSHHHIW